MAPFLYSQKDNQTRYTIAQFIELRRQMLRFARSLPRGPERNERRQIAASLGRLFRNKAWLETHTIPGAAYQVYTVYTDGKALNAIEIDRPNDRAAFLSAKQFVDGHDFQLWQGDRKVAEFEHKPE